MRDKFTSGDKVEYHALAGLMHGVVVDQYMTGKTGYYIVELDNGARVIVNEEDLKLLEGSK